jgi:CHAD domain-containing protein
MAKPIRIVGLKRNTPIARAAARVLRAVLLDLLEKMPDGRRDDPPKRGIHDLRVAVKRFREAFRLFRPALRKKTFRKHREWIEELNDTLGEVRDRDVALSRLRRLADGAAPPNASLAELIARLESERLGAADALSALIARLQLEGLTAELAAAIDAIEPPAKSAQTTLEFARERVRERLLDMRGRWADARRQATPESLHRARIRNKRLRYAIEPFSRMLGKEVRRLYRSASRFHDVLGDLHDADTMAVMLETAMARAPGPERRNWEGLAVKVARSRRVALRRAFALADAIEPLWDEAQKAVEEPAA